MPKGTIDHLIINSPFEKPSQYWEQDQKGEFELKEGRRPAGYTVQDTRYSGGSEFVELETVNLIRKRVDEWRENNYPGITTVTRKLLEHWLDGTQRTYPFYFAQLEAIETLIWYVEASEQYKQGIVLEGDGGAWERVCNKMATGSGKTTVMAMIITWQVINKATYPRDNRFSDAIFIVAPGITVKERLQVLHPSHEQNYYDTFNMAPLTLKERLRGVKLLIENWHTLMPLKINERSVVKKGKESDEAFCRRVLGKLSNEKHLIVINDEAHHAYRIPAELKTKKIAGLSKDEQEEATRWIEGLDRIHGKRGILRCFDLSATPFAPTGKKTKGEALFSWIVSDFGLNDAIESGLVKTPRVVIRDDSIPDAKTYQSRLYHIYNDDEVKDDLNRKSDANEKLPPLVEKAFNILGADWLKTKEAWSSAGFTIPPAMLTVCNRTETAARVENFFVKGDVLFDELSDKHKTLRVDSKILKNAELGENKTGDKDYEAKLHEIVNSLELSSKKKEQLLSLKKEELLREIIDNVGKPGYAGEQIQNVISVAMLSEGWDAKNVTHIMGLRAFTSQLLCEQVIGRGLRRTAYEANEETGLFEPEYVNIFGVPFSFLPHEGGGGAPQPPKPKTMINLKEEEIAYEIKWPNILRIDHVMNPKLVVDWGNVDVLEIKPDNTPMTVELAPIVDGKSDVSKYTKIELEKIEDKFRLQHVIFQSSRRVFESLHSSQWQGDKGYFIFQIIKIVEEFIKSDKISIPSLFHQDELRKRVLLALNIDKIVEHVSRFIRLDNIQKLEPIFDPDYPIRSTSDMHTWYTSKPCYPTRKCHVSHVVVDSAWEAAEAYIIQESNLVDSFVKNDHLGFEILYMFNGIVRKYRPDFLIKLTNGKTLVLEVKGKDSPQNKAKRDYLDEWVQAVNQKGGFGEWCWDVSFDVSDVRDIINRHIYENAHQMKNLEDLFRKYKFVDTKTIQIPDYSSGSSSSTEFMLDKVTLKDHKITVFKPKYMLDTLKRDVDNPIETITNVLGNGLGIKDIVAGVSSTFLPATLTLIGIALSIGKTMTKEMMDYDYAAVLSSLQNTDKTFGLDVNTVVKDANIYISKKINNNTGETRSKYPPIEIDKVIYILNELKYQFQCIDVIEEKWFLMDKMVIK